MWAREPAASGSGSDSYQKKINQFNVFLPNDICGTLINAKTVKVMIDTGAVSD